MATWANVVDNKEVGVASTTLTHARAVGGCEDMPTSPNPTPSIRRSLSVRTRFEVFKRDDFQCRYCGRRSPVVVLQVDHVVPVIEGGDDDPINLVTSCWECNSGKGGVLLNEAMPAEDPTDRAVLLLERERQLREYNEVLATIRERRERHAEELLTFWTETLGRTGIPKTDWIWLCRQMEFYPVEIVRNAMLVAIDRNATNGFRYVSACLRNWREDGKI